MSVEAFLSRVDLKKLKINTLLEIFKLFEINLGQKKSKLTFSSQYDKFGVLFDYEDRKWTASVTIQQSWYKKQEWRFINIKLPNYGFVYRNSSPDSSRYTPDRKQMNLDNSDALKFLVYLSDYISNLGLQEFDPTCRIHFDPTREQVEFYFLDEKFLKGITIKYKYGWCDHENNDKDVYTQEEIRNMLKCSH
jgi:hypothetical protein